jgi:hypothetical protein
VRLTERKGDSPSLGISPENQTLPKKGESMTNNLTDIKPTDIITHIEQNFNRPQAIGLNCLIFLALREGTNVGHQRKEWGFGDIPEQMITWCDQLDNDDLLELGTAIANGLYDEIIVSGLEA